MKDTTQERVFQDEIISQMVANGWVQGTDDTQNRKAKSYLCKLILDKRNLCNWKDTNATQ